VSVQDERWHERAPWKRHARWLVPLATLGLLALFARSVDWRHAWSATVHADPSLLAVATLANLATLVIKGVRWWVFLRPAGVRGLGQTVRATVAGAALNNVLVANGGDAARVAIVARRERVPSAAVLATLAVDRLCDLVTYGVLFVGAAFAMPLPPELARWRTPGLVVFGTFAAVSAVLLRRRSPTVSQAATESAPHESFLARARAYWRTLVATSASVATGPRIVLAIFLSLVAWGGQWATFHFAAHAAAFPTTAAHSLLALLVVNASFLVRLTPGNVGVFQLLYTLAATSTGLDRDSAVAVAFLIQLVQYIPVTVIGLLLAPSLASGSRLSRVAELVTNPMDGNEHPRLSGSSKHRT
jgi:uncharacterized protein (TIRG00374 family)